MTTIENILGKQKYIKADLEIKAKEFGIKGYSKMTKDKLIETILYEHNKPPPEKLETQVKKIPLKKTIPKTLKNNVWDVYIGKEKGIGGCFACHQEIDSKHFECGHVIAESDGGDITTENLRPICSLCNKSMGTTNMNIFKDKLAKSSKIVILSQFLNEYMFVSKQPNIYHSTPANRNYENYDDVLFAKIEKLWCNIDKINEFVIRYQKDKNRVSIIESIKYITEYAPPASDVYIGRYFPDTSYKEINKDKLIRWLCDNNLNVIDITQKKIEAKNKDNIDCNNNIDIFRYHKKTDSTQNKRRGVDLSFLDYMECMKTNTYD
jgi:hypothetical protein